MLAATKAGAGNLDHFSSFQVGGPSEVKPRRLKDYADVISWLLAEFDQCFQKFNNLKPQFALFAAPFDVGVSDVGYSRWRYWIWSVTSKSRSTRTSSVICINYCIWCILSSLKTMRPPTEWYLAVWPAPPNEFETPDIQVIKHVEWRVWDTQNVACHMPCTRHR